VGEAFFDPVAVVPGFVQQGAGRAAQVVRPELAQRLAVLLRQQLGFKHPFRAQE
jgi:hypothetical protein